MRLRSRRPLAALVAAATTFAVLSGAPNASAATPTDLFFSEYIEGTSNNKALEVFNGTGAAVDLTGYSIQIFFNGSTTAGFTLNLTGSVADGDVFVMASASASPVILAQADVTTSAGLFNGDDAITLRRPDTTIIASIGQVGVDPGTEWGTGLTSTADNTLRRKATVTSGDTDPSDAFDPAATWDGFATDTFDGLGSHTLGGGDQPATLSCGPTLTTSAGTAATRTVTATDADDTITDLAVTSVTPTPAAGSISRTAFTPASAVGGTASADVTVS